MGFLLSLGNYTGVYQSNTSIIVRGAVQASLLLPADINYSPLRKLRLIKGNARSVRAEI